MSYPANTPYWILLIAAELQPINTTLCTSVARQRRQQKKVVRVLLKQLPGLRTAVADYMQSEGCDCCRDTDNHRIHQATLAKLLDIPAYPDGSGYDFNRFCTRPTKIS